MLSLINKQNIVHLYKASKVKFTYTNDSTFSPQEWPTGGEGRDSHSET